MAVSINNEDWGNVMLTKLQPLWKEASLCDTTVECSEKNIIQAHSILLAAASPKLYSYFRATEEGSYTIVTPDIPVFVWRNILSFIYYGRVELRPEELIATYNFAHKMEIFTFCKVLGKELIKCRLTLEDHDSSMSEGQANCQISPTSKVAKSRKRSSTSLQDQSTSPKERKVEPVKLETAQLLVTESQLESSMESKQALPDMKPSSNLAENVNVPGAGVNIERRECPGCFQSFNRASSLSKHLAECPKLQDKPAAASGVVSYKNFYTKLGQNVKQDGAKFKCDLCGKEYATYQGLYSHLKSTHGDRVKAVAATDQRHFRPGQNKSTKSQQVNKRWSCEGHQKTHKAAASEQSITTAVSSLKTLK